MSGDTIDQLYNALKADGAVSGTRENFRNFALAKGDQGYFNRKKLYESLKADGAVSSATYEEFARKLGIHAVKPQKKQAIQTSAAPQQAKPTTLADKAQLAYQQYQQGKTQQPSHRPTQQVPQQTRSQAPQAGTTTDYMQNWNLMHMRQDKMTPAQRAQAQNQRDRMQRAQSQAYQQEQKANPIAKSKVTPTAKSFNETMQSLSSNDAQKARAIQQHQDDAMNLAGYEVNENNFTQNDGKFGTIAPMIDSVVDASIKEADELTKQQYAENVKKQEMSGKVFGIPTGNLASQYDRDMAFKGAQDLQVKNRQKVVVDNLSKKLQEIYSQQGMQEHIVESAEKLNMGVEEYVNKYVTPQIMNRAQQVLGIKNIEDVMPGGTMGYIAKNLSNSILGMIVAPNVMSKDTRQRMQQGIAIADGLEEMPTVKGRKDNTYRSGIGTRFLSTATNMAVDSGPMALIGSGASASVDLGKRILTNGLMKVGLLKEGANLTAQQLGFKIANMTMAQKIGSGLLEGSAKGALNLAGYSGVTAALGQASTGDDTSLAAIARAGYEGAKHGAETGAMFGLSGAVMAPWVSKFGINGMETSRGQRWLHGAQKAGATALGLGVEAGTMMIADNITGDKEISVGQWLEDVVMVGAFKAGEPSNFGKIANALHHITHNTNNTFRFGKDSDGNWRTVDIKLNDAEKNELMASTSGKNLMDAFNKVDKSSLNSKDNIDKSITKLAYQEFMNDPSVSQSTKEKVNAAMGLFNTERKRSYRSVNDVQNKQVLEYSQDGTLLTRTPYKNAEERRDILYRQKAYRDNEDLLSLVGYARLKDRQYLDKDGKITDNAKRFLNEEGFDLNKPDDDPNNAYLLNGLKDKSSEVYAKWVKYADRWGELGDVKYETTHDDFSIWGMVKDMLGVESAEHNIFTILNKDPLKRTDMENEIARKAKTILEEKLFPENEAHAEQSQSQGKSIAEDNGLGSEQPNSNAVVTELNNLSQAEDDLAEAYNSNDIFKEGLVGLAKLVGAKPNSEKFGDVLSAIHSAGITNPQIYDMLADADGKFIVNEADLEPFARYINANARVQGMQQATAEAIEQHVESMVGDWGFHGTMDGQKADGSQMLYVQDSNGRTLIVGSGDVAYDPTTGKAKEGVGDMLVCFDPNTREMAYVKAEETTLLQTQSVEDFKNEERTRLQQINSEPYNQAAAQQAAKDAAKPQPKEEDDSRKELAEIYTKYLNEEKAQLEDEEIKLQGQMSMYGEDADSKKRLEEIRKRKENIDEKLSDYSKFLDSSQGKEPQPKEEVTNDNQTAQHSNESNTTLSLDVSVGDRIKSYKITPHERVKSDGTKEITFSSEVTYTKGAPKGHKEGEVKNIGDGGGFVRISPDVIDWVEYATSGRLFVDENGQTKRYTREMVTNEDVEEQKGIIESLLTPQLAEWMGPQYDVKKIIIAPDGRVFAQFARLKGNIPLKRNPLERKEDTVSVDEKSMPRTFSDGTDVPMVKDSKGRPTPDYANMKPEQAAEILSEDFGENAEKVVDGQIKKAEKAVKDAEKMKVDYTAEPNDILEQEQKKKVIADAANKQLEHAQAIKKAMTQKKVAETMAKPEGEATEGANQASSAVAEKFSNATRLVGNKRTRTLPNSEKIKGRYEIVPAESLTPSHDAMNGYKKSEGFPVDENGRTINDRDYENDKAAQQTTDQMALKYNGQAIDQVPVVSDEGIVYDGNGRTMAGQKAAKDGTDGEYISDLLDNAENFGFTREQIENSGIEHPRLVLVTDERMPYDTATFTKFNRNEKKAQSNTEQAVAKSKTLTSDEIGSIVADIEGNGSLEAFFNNPKAISDLVKTLQNKGIIGQNEVAGLMEGEYLNPQGKELVKNILLGAAFKPETIRMMGIDSAIKTKVVSGIRAVLDNMKLGDYALRDEIDQSIQLLYEARTNKMNVDDLLRSSDFVNGNARDRYTQISQALAQALENKATLFRDLMREYNEVAKSYNTNEGSLSFYEHLSKDELLKEFVEKSNIINDNNIKLYGEEGRHSEKKDGDVPTGNEERPEEAGGGVGEEKSTESQQQVDEAVKKLATDITKQTGVTVHTNEKESQKALEDAEATDSNIKYHKETDKETLERLEKEPKIKVYRAMQVIDGKLYPPMAASVGGKLVEANELGTWIRADENPNLAIPDIDPKTGKQKVDPKTGEPKWKFKLDKGGKDATGKKATAINAAYNPYWHLSRSPLNDQFKSAWIRPNVVVVECEVPESELSSGYKAERAKDAVGEVDWKSGSVSGEVFKQTGRARKVILSRWCKPVRVLDDAEVAQKAKEFVGDAKVEIPENVLTPKQRIAFEDAGFKIGAPEKGVKKSEQIADALKAGLEIDNSLKETSLETVSPLSEESVKDSAISSDAVAKVRENLDSTKEIYKNSRNKTRGFITDISQALGLEQHEASHYGKFRTADGREFVIRISNHNTNARTFDENGESEGISIVISRGRNKGIRGKEDTRAHVVEFFYSKKSIDRAEGKPLVDIIDSLKDTIVTGEYKDKTGLAHVDEVNGSVKEFRTKDGEVYGFVVDGEIHLDTKKMKPETPLHEYTHLWTSALQRVNSKEWENVKGLLDSVDGLKEEVQKLYPELEGDDLYDEMLATYSGREGAKKLEETAKNIAAEEGKTLTESVKAKSFLGKVKEALKRYWNDVADMLGIHFTSAEDVADKVLADWASGVNPNEIKPEEKAKEVEKLSAPKTAKVDVDYGHPEKNIHITNTSNGYQTVTPFREEWQKKTGDERLSKDGWHEKNGYMYFINHHVGGRGGDNCTIWFKDKLSEEQKRLVEELFFKTNNLGEDFQHKLLDIVSGKADEKSEPITITVHGNEHHFSSEEVDVAKKILAEYPEKPISKMQREMMIGYDTAKALAKELGWKNPNEKIKILPKEDNEPSNPNDPMSAMVKAADDFKKEHPMTEEEIMAVDGLDDEAKYTAIDYLNGEDDSEIARICYEQAYNKRKTNTALSKVSDEKESSADPMEGLRNASESYNEGKTQPKPVSPKTIAEKKAAAKKLKEENDKKTQDLMNQFLAAKDEKKNGSGKLYSLPFPVPSWALKWMDRNLSLTDKQKEILPKLLSAIKGSMYARIKEGIYNLEDVIENVRKDFKAFFDALDKDDANKILAEAAYKGRFTDPDTGERIKLSEAAEREKKLSPEHQDKLVGDSKTAEERKQREESFISNLKMIMGGRKVDGIRELRQLAKELGLEGVKDTDLQELAETAVVSRARDIANSKAMSPERKFAEIKKLYANQPSLNMRDSDRIRHQQYSTPAPYAYLADMYVNGNGSKEIKSALEPSAGNGMLTIGLPMDKVHVNDIDEARLMNLHRQGFKTITSQDGTQPFADKDVDVVVTNPPFGSATPKEYDGYKISSLEGQMAINALDSMKDDGRAAIIIGGKTEYAKNGSLNPKDKAFLGYLYSHYNVEDVINVDGSLYAKQGTTYPTRIILINGRRLDENSFPPVKDKARAETVKDYDELYKRIKDDLLRSRELDSSNGRELRGAESESDKRGSINPDEKGVRGRDGGRKREDKGVSSGVSGESAIPGTNDELGNGRGTNGESDGRLSDGSTGTDTAGTETAKGERGGNISNRPDGGQLHQSGGVGRNDAQRRSDESHRVEEKSFEEKKSEVKRGLSTEKVNYASKSNNPFTLQSVMPADQQEAVNKNLAKLGDADQFLVDELGYNDKDDLYKHLAAEQIDSVALAIHQAKQGNGFIIGDMTGIGKGRQAASLIRYAKKQGQIPVYFTKTAGLLSDVYRDLVDVGSSDLRPFVFGSDKEANITDSDGNLVYKLPTDKEKDRVISYINRYGKLPKEYDYILTTYSQVSNGVYEFDDNGNKKERKPKNGFTSSHYKGQKRRDAIEKVIDNGYLILDESHTAGGDSGQGNYFQHIIQKAKSVTFFSATFAKRPDNMPIYALRTAMNQGGLKPSELIDAVKRGGATLQEIMSKTLTESGQMIRRERDMTGVTIDWKSIDDPVVVSEQREQYDNIIGLFNDIINFQKSYVIPYIDSRNEELAAIQSSMGLRKGTESLGIKSTPFASKAFNTVQQVLLSLKAKEAARRAIDYLKQDIKPVIALSNTNESQSGEIKENVEVEEPDLSTSLKKGLAGTLRYTTKNSKNKEENGDIKLEDLGSEGVEAYNALMKKIESASTGLALSPIDVIKNELQKAGYKVGELTGRKSEFIYNENGSVTKVKRSNTDKKKLAREFNDGTIDALILNKSASTGISLHASNKFGDQRKRVMIVAQQQLDVNDEVQMRGRIDRTGQVSRGAYEYIVSQIPAEQRLLMMFKAKLKSLDANTTASQKSKFNEMDVADITNKYGDKIVREYAAEHLDIYSKMADPFNWEKDGIDLSQIDPQKLINSKGGRNGEYEPGADASKFLGRMALLKVEEQEKMLSEISDLYANEINRLNEMGENDLEITELPLKAKTVGKEVWKEGSEPNGDNAFADNTYIEKVNMAILKKPMKAEEVKKAQDGLTGSRSWDEYRNEKRASLKQYFDEKIASETERLEQRAQKIAQKAADKYKKEAKKNLEQNQFTDEKIEKNAQFQYDNIYKQEKEKAATAIKNIKTKQEAFERVLDTFNTEDAYVLPSDMNNPNEMSAFGNSYGRLIDIKITDNYSPTASTVSFATLDGRRKITFPVSGKVGSGDSRTDVISTIFRLTKQAEGMSDKQLHVLNMDVNNWDKLVSNESRKDGYIITGNLMQALIDTKSQGLGGQLIKYTTDTGEVKTGILMPDRFKPTDASTDAPISAKADDFIQGKVDDLTSKDGDVKLTSVSTWRGTTIELRVPKSTKRGGKYFLDDKLRSFVDGNDFSTKGNSMTATVSLNNVRSVLKRLSELGVRVKEERKEGTHFRIEENSENGESSEKLFLSLQSKDKSNNRKEYNDTVTELANRVKQGTARIVREGEEDGLDRRNSESIPAIVGKILATNDTEGSRQNGGVVEESRASDNEKRTEKKDSHQAVFERLEDWAKDNDCYFTEEDVKRNSLGEKAWNTDGAEATIYRTKDGSHVTKVMPVYSDYENPISHYLDRNKSFNEVFPETAIEVVGYGRDENGKQSIIYKQPFVEGETVYEHFKHDYTKSYEYIDKYMESLGYEAKTVERDGMEWDIYTNGKYNLFDVNYSNVIIDKDGKPHVIDAEVLPVDYNESGKVEIKDADSTRFRTDSATSSVPSTPSSIVADNVAKVSEKVGSKVNMVNSPEEVTNPAVKERLDKGENVTGWYDEKTGEVHLYMPNIHDTYTAEKTIWHETVGHKAMRGLIGDENYSTFLRNVWYDLDKPENARLKELVDDELKYNPLNYENAVEEGIARLVEDGKGEVGFWNNIRNKVADIFRSIGYHIAPNTKDVKYLLWLSKNLQKNPNNPYWKMKAEAVRYKLEHEKYTTIKNGMFADNDGKVKDYSDFTRKDWEEATDMTVHFRTTPAAATEIAIYNRAVGNVKAMAEEAYSDKMNSVLELYKAIDPSIKRAEDVKTSENPYMLENLMSSRAQQVGNAFVRDYMKPATKALDDVLGSFPGSDLDEKMRNANLYIVKKSGLERNRAFFVRDQIRKLSKKEETQADAKQLQADWDAEHQRLKGELDNKQITLKEYFDGLDDFIRKNIDDKYKAGEHDYSGFHEMQGVDYKDAVGDAKIQDEVMSAESSIGDSRKVDELWRTINAATDYSLDMEYKGGFMDSEMNQYVKGEMNWYVPMRMFDKETAEDVYGYVNDNGGSTGFVGPALMKAKGRKSLANLDILAQIGAMGEHAINRAARNGIKQAFMRFVNNNEKAPVGERLVTEVKPWFEKVVVGGVETWEERYPQIPEDATPLEISQAVAKFESDMKIKEANGDAKQGARRGNINYKFADKAHRPQHIVDVWVNGKKKSYVINGNPRAAQAINGMLDHKSASNWFSKSNRWLSQACTSYNPEFTLRNAIRDFGFATHTLLGKEGAAYAMKFEKHYAALGFAPIINAAKGIGNGSLKDVKNALAISLFKQYKNGTLDVTKSKYHKWFKEFMDNGGETGYLQMKNVDAWKKQIENDIKDMHKGKLKKLHPIKAVGGFVEDINEMAENIARFATFCASRESGRNVTRAAYDAKEVSVNFNRSGSAENVRSYKYENMSGKAEKARNGFAFTSSYLRNYTMFFNASVQSFKGLYRNVKHAPVRTIASMVAEPIALGLMMPLINQMLYALLDDDEKDRNGVKDPYLELPEYERRYNLCIYAGKGRFVKIPIAIEGRAFYGLGDIVASYTYKKDLKESRSLTLDIANQLAQIVPVGSFLESSATSGDSKSFLTSLGSTFLPSTISPAIELIGNRDWKGQPIYNDATYMENAPAWKKANKGTSELFLWANKKANAWTNDVDPGNENMKGSTVADVVTNPFAWEQLFNSYAGGMGTFATRTGVTIKHALSKDSEVETKDIPFIRSLLYTPSNQTSLQRTKSKWYNYKDEMETTNYNLTQLNHDSKDPVIGLKSAAAYFKYINSPKSEEVNIVNDYNGRIKELNKILKVVTDDEARKDIENQKDKLIQEAVAKLDSIN